MELCLLAITEVDHASLQVRRNGTALGAVVERSTRRWGTELALPLDDADKFHFLTPLEEDIVAQLTSPSVTARCAGSRARDEALAYIAGDTDLVPVGMAIGPFSLLTRLMKDPITTAGLVGAGGGPEESPEIRLLEQVLRIAKAATLRSVRSQIVHGAKAIMVCEPAASVAYISPRQMRSGAILFESLVMAPNLAVKEALDSAGVDLIFHDCGELIPEMVEAFAHRLHPVILSLGSSRKLWEDAAPVENLVTMFEAVAEYNARLSNTVT